MAKEKVKYRIDHRNYRKHSQKNLALIERSLAENGAGRSILLDSSGESIAGSGTLQMAMKRGIPIREVHTNGEELIAVIRDDISPDDPRRKSLALADNATTDLSQWDFDQLREDDWSAEDLSDWGIDVPEEKTSADVAETAESADDDVEDSMADDGYFGDARELTFNAYKLHDFDPEQCCGKYQIPKLKPCKYIPDHLLSFKDMLSVGDFTAGIHFFTDDYRFERIWRNTAVYLERLAKFKCVFTPDFSLYLDMPLAMQIWNTYRNRMIGQICQNYGMNVIPTIGWAGEDSFEFCFDGLPAGGTVAVSTVGVMKNKEAKEIFQRGMEEMIKRVKPGFILVYGNPFPESCGNIPFKSYPNEAVSAWMKNKKR
jgi:hypothetical protein